MGFIGWGAWEEHCPTTLGSGIDLRSTVLPLNKSLPRLQKQFAMNQQWLKTNTCIGLMKEAPMNCTQLRIN